MGSGEDTLQRGRRVGSVRANLLSILFCNTQNIHTKGQWRIQMLAVSLLFVLCVLEHIWMGGKLLLKKGSESYIWYMYKSEPPKKYDST